MKNYRHIFFDLHFTLIETKQPYSFIYQSLYDSHFKKSVSVKQIDQVLKLQWSHYKTNDLAKEHSLIRNEIDLSRWWSIFHSSVVRKIDPSIDLEAALEFGEHFNSAFCSDPTIFKQVKNSEALLKYLKKNGTTTSIVTNSNKSIRKVIEALPLKKYVDEIIISSEVGCTKPNPGVLSQYFKKYTPNLNECLFIGDSFTDDILLANRIGMDSCIYLFDPKVSRTISATYAINNLWEISTL